MRRGGPGAAQCESSLRGVVKCVRVKCDMSPPSVCMLAVAVAVLFLASGAAGRPSDDWTPSRSQSRAFGASRRSYSTSSSANTVTTRHEPNKAAVVAVAAAPADVEDSPAEARGFGGASKNEVGDEEGSWMSWLPSAEMRVLGKVWEDCSERDDMTGCLKGKALTFLERAARKQSLSLPGGLQLVRTARADTAVPITDAALEAELPRDLSQRETRLDQMLLDRVVSFLQTHALRFNLADEDSSAGSERGLKKKDLLPYLLLGKLVASSMVAMAFTGLALLAGKALMVSKIALLLSGIVALKKLFGGGHSGGGGVEVVNVPASGHGHYGRSFDGAAEDAAHSLAFRGQIQRPTTKA